MAPASCHRIECVMKFFDANVMIGQTIVPTPNAFLDAHQLLSEMDRLDIDRALFFHYSPREEMEQMRDMNRLTLKAAGLSDRLIPTWVISTAITRVGENLEDQIDRMLD